MKTEPKSSHSPTPWIVRSHPHLGSFVERPKREGEPYGQEILADEDYPEKEADVVHIVMCVNSHPHLVQRLNDAMAFARIKFGNLDPDFNIFYDESQSFLSSLNAEQQP